MQVGRADRRKCDRHDIHQESVSGLCFLEAHSGHRSDEAEMMGDDNYLPLVVGGMNLASHILVARGNADGHDGHDGSLVGGSSS
jgi:hypothetical protein